VKVTGVLDAKAKQIHVLNIELEQQKYADEGGDFRFCGSVTIIFQYRDVRAYNLPQGRVL